MNTKRADSAPAGDDRTELESYLRAAYEAHNATLVRFANSKSRNQDAASDFAQEAFLRLATEVFAGRRPDNVKAWLFRVCANLVVSDARRSRSFQNARSRMQIDGVAIGPDIEALNKERDLLLGKALSRLGSDVRTALQLAAVGCKGRETARVIGRTETATRAMMCRARVQLRRDLGALIGPESA